jgi:transcriptional regulator GlxA family with amidase domain
VLANVLAFWRRERLGLALAPGVDEVSLALVADAWSRTYRSRAVAFAATGAAQRSRNGIDVYPDEVMASAPAPRLPSFDGLRPAAALDAALEGIATRYGPRTANVVAMQLEYPKRWATR